MMRIFKYFFVIMVLAIPGYVLAGGPPVNSEVDFVQKDQDDEDVFSYYDLRERKTYIQVSTSTPVFNDGETTDSDVCIHVQIFQQDQGCSELDFEDVLTINDTVIYDMDDLFRNDGSEVPVNLDDDSYGFVAISAYDCDDGDDEEFTILYGNTRIIDDAGYEYRMNLFADDDSGDLIDFDSSEADANVVIPFNTVDGATHADIVGFLVDESRFISGQDCDGGGCGGDSDADDFSVYNEEKGITFSVFLLDEDEERLSCDQKTIGCGPGITLNYGINEDYPNSKGGPLLCEGAGLLPGQEHGYISLENASVVSPLDEVPTFNETNQENDALEFICMYGLNNGNGTGSMDSCIFKCLDPDGGDCNNN